MCGVDSYDSVKVGFALVDYDGNSYSTVKIGNQTWMAENLRTTSYRNGNPITNITNPNEWDGNFSLGAWAHYNNDSQNENPYGKLYNGYAISGNVCPVGWHVPTDAEWTELSDFLGGENVAGWKMKSIGTEYWQSPNTDATNESGFSGLPGGNRNINGTFGSIGEGGWWWSSTEYFNDYLYYRTVASWSGQIGGSHAYKKDGYSVRCLRD